MANFLCQDKGPWYFQKMYARYWKHYNEAMEWMYRHKNAYRKAMELVYNPSLHPSEQHQRYSDWDENVPGRTGPSSFSTSDSKPRRPPRPQDGLHYVRKRRAAEKDSETNSESESEEDIECDLDNMEITEELRHYFEQTERHQEELRVKYLLLPRIERSTFQVGRKQKQLEAEHQEMYVEADHSLHLSTSRSAQPPAEKPGERRMAEMRKLYGKGANKIQAMETTMQLNFDRNCDTKQPKYWPIISLKL
ncbi:gem-associated protein 8 isoform X1 [Thamnophis elegans]|uniref:gem-associated protein 8 isoform X1 n=1 Tax=Thamnophis elegans TaxID=35005 RepID=UPI0013788F45|nr:gem-associated protein 8 isoform X1 [Thamnophis elegans]XP_032082809.1 gem-associated protein 8 isoform X1 [Thamnophis elegans]